MSEAQRALFESDDGRDDGNARRPPNKPTDPFPGVATGPGFPPSPSSSPPSDPTDRSSDGSDRPDAGRSGSFPSRSSRRRAPGEEADPAGFTLPPKVVGSFEGRDGQVRPGLAVGWPWHRWSAQDEAGAARRAVVEAIGREFARGPAVRPGGRVVFASSRLAVFEATAEEVAVVVASGGRTIPATVERGGTIFRLVKLGTWAWACAGMDAVFEGFRAGRIAPEAWKGALFAWARLRVALERAEAFTPAALDWADQHGAATPSRAYAIQGLPTGGARG